MNGGSTDVAELATILLYTIRDVRPHVAGEDVGGRQQLERRDDRERRVLVEVVPELHPPALLELAAREVEVHMLNSVSHSPAVRSPRPWRRRSRSSTVRPPSPTSASRGAAGGRRATCSSSGSRRGPFFPFFESHAEHRVERPLLVARVGRTSRRGARAPRRPACRARPAEPPQCGPPRWHTVRTRRGCRSACARSAWRRRWRRRRSPCTAAAAPSLAVERDVVQVLGRHPERRLGRRRGDRRCCCGNRCHRQCHADRACRRSACRP